MADASKTPVPIIGGGIAGLTTALCLAHCGIASHIYEKAEQFDDVGAGIQLSPNAMAVMQVLGLDEALSVHGVKPQRIAIRDGRSDIVLASVALGQTAESRYGAPYLVIHRADLQRVLVEACTANPLITIDLAATVDPDPEESPVIAADGVHSAWRALLRDPAQKRFTGFVAWRTTQALPQPDTNPETRIWLGPDAHLVDYPIQAGTARNIVAIARASDPRPVRSNPKGQLDKTFSAWHSSLRKRLADQEDWTPWPLFGVDPQGVWANEHVALVGDAAHAMLPFSAQGGAMAIEDAWVLAQMITSTDQTNQALARYEMARKARVTKVWNEAARNAWIYHLTGPMALARNTVLRTRSPDSLLARYDWLYDWKPTTT